MEVNAEVKRGKKRQRNSPVDCFDISPKVHSTCDKIHPLPPRRHKLYVACGDFFISFFKIATSLIPRLLLFPKKLTLFGDPDICFCCKDRDSNRAIRRIETVRWTVSLPAGVPKKALAFNGQIPISAPSSSRTAYRS